MRAVRDGVSTVMVYDALGRLSAEYEAGVAGPLHPQCLTMDQLGSVRMATDGAGDVLRRADYLPFGEEIPVGLGGRTLAGYGQAGPRQRFTGKERDAEMGLDYFGARSMSAAQGGCASPDEPFANPDISDPQSWNLDAHVRNNPLRNLDFDGRNCWQVTASSGMVNYVDDGLKNTPTCSDYFKSTERARAHRVDVESDASVPWDRSTGLSVLAEAGGRASDGSAMVDGFRAAQEVRTYCRNPIRHTISHFIPAPDALV